MVQVLEKKFAVKGSKSGPKKNLLLTWFVCFAALDTWAALAVWAALTTLAALATTIEESVHLEKSETKL